MGLPFYPLSQTHTKFRIVPDALVDGRRFRILCVIDDFSWECIAAVVDNSISGERVARELDAIAEHRGSAPRWLGGSHS